MNRNNVLLENKANLVEGKDVQSLKGYIVRFDKPYFDGTTRKAEEYTTGLKMFSEQDIKIPLLYLHTSEAQGGRPIGVMESYEIDDKGIIGYFRLNNTPFVRDEVLPAIESGSLTHFSTEETDKPDRIIVAVALVPIGNAINARVEYENKVREQIERAQHIGDKVRRVLTLGLL